MKVAIYFIIGVLSFQCLSHEITIRKNVEKTAYHHKQESSPEGRLKGPFEFHSKAFPGTSRHYWIFVPAQYNAASPANVLVFQDGHRAIKGSLSVPRVMTNLIAKKEIPITIGIFITPGNRSSHFPEDIIWRNPDNRAQEYDVMDDRYARLVVDEILPEVAKSYNLTSDPEKRLIGGTSSGAIAAFTVAWHRPEAFRNVYSAIGSYVSIGFRADGENSKLGGQDYPALIRREAIRPMKVFFQDGNADLDNEWGNWFLANQQMVSALAYVNRNANEKELTGPRYQYKAVWTDGKQDDSHGGAILPEALKWFWDKDVH